MYYAFKASSGGGAEMCQVPFSFSLYLLTLLLSLYRGPAAAWGLQLWYCAFSVLTVMWIRCSRTLLMSQSRYGYCSMKRREKREKWLFRRGSFPLDLARYFSRSFFGIKRNTQRNENINSSHGLILTKDSIPCLPHQTTDGNACQLVVTTPSKKIIWSAGWWFPEGQGREGEVEKGRGRQTCGDRRRSDLGWWTHKAMCRWHIIELYT